MVLKNNVKTEIHNVEFLITYLDMNGNVLDKKEFSSLINIKPEMRGELRIPAFRHNEHYQYYKNSDGIVGHPNFKITAKLQRYNIDDYEVEQFTKRTPRRMYRMGASHNRIYSNNYNIHHSPDSSYY